MHRLNYVHCICYTRELAGRIFWNFLKHFLYICIGENLGNFGLRLAYMAESRENWHLLGKKNPKVSH
jgi:hypothetical protein